MQRALNTYIHKAHAQHWDTRLGDACCLLTLFSVDFDYKVENNTWAHFSVCLRVRVCIKYIYTTHFVWVPWKIQNTFWFEYQFASCVFEQESWAYLALIHTIENMMECINIYKIKMQHRQNIITVQTQTPETPFSSFSLFLFVQVISMHANRNSINIAVQSVLLLRWSETIFSFPFKI